MKKRKKHLGSLGFVLCSLVGGQKKGIRLLSLSSTIQNSWVFIPTPFGANLLNFQRRLSLYELLVSPEHGVTVGKLSR